MERVLYQLAVHAEAETHWVKLYKHTQVFNKTSSIVVCKTVHIYSI